MCLSPHLCILCNKEGERSVDYMFTTMWWRLYGFDNVNWVVSRSSVSLLPEKHR